MADLEGFWSYVQDDNKAEGNRILLLAKNIVEQFELLTGEKILLFTDKDTIKWGEKQREIIDGHLETVAFFIPVLTPRYFMSSECRRECQLFARNAALLGVNELILPLLYTDVPHFHEEASKDDLIVLIRKFQWEDWRDLRFADTASEEYRKGVARLAERLVKANRDAEGVSIPVNMMAGKEVPDDVMDNPPGLLEKMVDFEETLPKIGETIESITHDISIIGDIMRKATADIQRGNEQGKGFAARLVVARRVAKRLEEPVERIWSSSNEFATQIHTIDTGVRLFIERAPSEREENPDSKTNFCSFFKAAQSFSVTTKESLESVRGMIASFSPIEKMSRDLHPVLRHLRQGLTIMVEAGEVSEEWVQLIEASGIICECDE